MQFRLRHLTQYSYTRPVFCDPLTVRLRPREDATTKLYHFSLNIWPRPLGVSQFRDVEGNCIARAWFGDLMQTLSISTTTVVETLCVNPFEFLLTPGAERLSVQIPQEEFSLASYYAQPTQPSDLVTQFARAIAQSVNWQTVPFLCELCSRLHLTLERTVRITGEAWSAEETLRERKGACRDAAVLFNECCRSLGLPARFVSGYGFGHEQRDERHLHAWSEVYLPGAGWRGFDASYGLATADRHIPLAASRDPAGAAPTCGAFRGADAKSRLETQLLIRRVDGPEEDATGFQRQELQTKRPMSRSDIGR